VTSESDDRYGLRGPCRGGVAGGGAAAATGAQRPGREGDAEPVSGTRVRAQVGSLQGEQRRKLPEERYRKRDPRQSAALLRERREGTERRQRSERHLYNSDQRA